MRVCSKLCVWPAAPRPPVVTWQGFIQHGYKTLSIRLKSRRGVCAVRRQVFVSTEWLQDNLNDVSIVDVRGMVNTQPAAPGVEKSTYESLKDPYLESHIPVAPRFFPVDPTPNRKYICPRHRDVDCVCEPVLSHKGIKLLDLNADNFAATAEEKGISTYRPVVVYDDGTSGSMFACRVWWSLTVHGHDNAHVLEGGWEAWTRADGPTEFDEPCPLKVMGTFEGSMRKYLYADIHDVVRASQDPEQDVQILDVRSLEQYQGVVRRSKHAGRIPGAVSLPYKQLMNPRHALLEQDELRRLFERVGVDLQKKVIVYCNGGVSACVVAAALDSLGSEDEPRNWSVYDGSWNEYGNQDTFPFDGG